MTGLDGALQRRLAGDLDRAFPELVEQMKGSVYNGVRRWVWGRQDAEDVTQEVFVRAYRALGDYSPERIAALRLRPWLFTITLNLCRNHARTQSRRPRQTVLDATPDVAGDAEVEGEAIGAVIVDEWRARLATLPARQRDAVVLRHVVGLGYDEIGEVLERPPGTVKSDVHRGLRRLRDILAQEEAK